MTESQNDRIAFTTPGGECCPQAGRRPIDMNHLAGQTMGDRAVEAEVLSLFVQQLVSVRGSIDEADESERQRLAHGLKGAARSVGAFDVADCAASIERVPGDAAAIRRLSHLIDEVRGFIAAVNR